MKGRRKIPYTLQDIVKEFGVSRIAVEFWRKAHKMPTYRDGGRVYIDPKAFEAWMQKVREILPTIGIYLARREGKDTFILTRTRVKPVPVARRRIAA